jgi:hypothetical protein
VRFQPAEGGEFSTGADSGAGAGSAIAKVLTNGQGRAGQQAARRCCSNRPSRRKLEPSKRFRDGRI